MQPLVQLRVSPSAPADAHFRTLFQALRREITGEVRFDNGNRALYATDGSNYRQVPIGVVVPRTIDDVVRTVAICRAHAVPVLPRGGGTSLAGQCCNTAVVVDFTKYLGGPPKIDAARRTAWVEPGTVLDTLRSHAEPYGLTFGPDPATHTHCTLGGMIGNNSCGIHAVQAEFYGPGARTSDNVRKLDILTYDGLRMQVGPTDAEEFQRIQAAGGRRAQIYRELLALRDRYADEIRARFPKIPRRVSGYDLPSLLPENGFNVARALVGSEGTCVTVLGAEVTLIDRLPARCLLVLGYPTVYDAGDHVPELRTFRPIGLEGMDHLLVQLTEQKHLNNAGVRNLPEGCGHLLVEFGAETQEEAEHFAREAMATLAKAKSAPHMKLFTEREGQEQLWKLRESGLGATAYVPGHPDTWPGWEDSAVPPDHVGSYLRDLRGLIDRYGYEAALYGHFGQGCIHCRISFDLATAPGVERYRRFTQEAAELVARHGGSLSGEHGDGQSRADLLPVMLGPALMQAFREFKEIWDPDNKMNPGKIINAYGRTENLRLGADYRPWRPATYFSYEADHRDFAHAALRCVGVGECRRDGGGTMCPSYMVTREEMHSTRGRARLLFEMLKGAPLGDGWSDPSVKEALDLCLACKGCKGECPVSVDMATYKAEFLAHYYESKRRPRNAYAFGWIDRWARLGSLAPDLVNFVTHTSPFQQVAKAAAGMAQEREIPRFAPRSFRSWFRPLTPEPGADGERVLLWPDTFNNAFRPETLAAAAEVLTRAGGHVTIPREHLCCGRPLYDYGMLSQAQRYWQKILNALGPEIDAGVPLVGLEPSCVAAFRDELVNLYPDDPRARRLRDQTFTLAEYLERRRYTPPRLNRRAVVHGHCHHKAVLGFESEAKLLARMGLELEQPDSGCCGMAGAFGFESDKYDVSIAVGERSLLPKVREVAGDTLVIADGFSCREQIAQTTDRRGLHTAEVLQLAFREAELERPAFEAPERLALQLAPRSLTASRLSLPTAATLFMAGLFATRWLRHRAGVRESRSQLPPAGREALLRRPRHSEGAVGPWHASKTMP